MFANFEIQTKYDYYSLSEMCTESNIIKWDYFVIFIQQEMIGSALLPLLFIN